VVGKLNISPQADAVRHLFMGLEEKAKKIKSCWLCGSPLSTLKLANQGHLSRNHETDCPFEEVALAAEECIKWRDEKQREFSAGMRRSEAVPPCDPVMPVFDSFGGCLSYGGSFQL
jgi:hypothetical protein